MKLLNWTVVSPKWPWCWWKFVAFLQGDTHLGGGLDTNGSTESFELVTEENNGDGKAKTDSRSTFYLLLSCLRVWGHDGKVVGKLTSKAACTVFIVCISCWSVCYIPFLSAPSSEDEWVPLELCFGMPLFSSELNRKVCRKIASHKLCSSERLRKTKHTHHHPQKCHFCFNNWKKFKDVCCSSTRLELCCGFFFSLQELLHSSRRLSLKVLSFVQSFQVKTLMSLEAAS